MQQIADRQTALETQLVQTSSVSRALSQPLSSQVPKASPPVPAVAKMMRSPVGGCAGSVAREVRSGEGDVGAVRAVLTTLKPSWRVQLRTRFRTCKCQAVQGPEAQQAELSSQSLAQQGGLSFDAVLKSMSKRMSPTSSAEKPAAELLSKRICGIYLERFGGYGRQRDLGVIRSQVMTALTFFDAGESGGSKGYSGVAGGDVGAGLSRLGSLRSGSDFDTAGGHSCVSIHQQAAGINFESSSFRAFVRSALGDCRHSVLDGARHHLYKVHRAFGKS